MTTSMTLPTKKEVVTRLAETLVSECQVGDAPKFVGDWEPLYEELRKRFESAYRVFELEFDHEIATFVNEVRTARQRLQSAEANFRDVCEHEQRILESKIEKAALDRRHESVDRAREAERLRTAQPDLLRSVRSQRVALTGGDDVSVPQWPGLASKLLFWATLTVFMGIEYLVGFELFDWVSNPNTALGLSAIVVVGFTAGTYFAVHRFRRIGGHREALRRFARNYPDGHPEGLSVELLPSVERHVAFTLATLLATFAIVILVGRIWIASTGELGFGGIAAAAGLLFCFVGYGAFEYYLAHPNSKQQVTDLRTAEARLDENESALQQALDSGAGEQRYRDATDRAIAEYNHAVDAEYTRYSDTSDVDSKREEILGAMYGYQLAWETFRSGLSDRYGQLVDRVSVRYGLKSEDIGLPDVDIFETFSRNVHRQYDNAALLEEWKPRFSAIALERPVIDVHKLKGEIELTVSMTPEAPDPSKPAEVPARAPFTSVRTKGASA